MLKAQSKGFTLVELMVVIAIIGLLGAVAIPSYSRYTQESRRMDANVGLRDAAQVMERCRTQQFSYIGCENTPKIMQRDASPDGYYQLAYTGITATTFTITATPTAGRAQTSDADCQVITINQTGQTAPLGCWK